jgi:gas vesicle protein
MSSTSKFLTGFIIGGAIGAVAGILLAPKSGEETRTMISDATDDLLKRTDKTIKEIRDKADDAVSDMQKKGDEIKGQLQKLIDNKTKK